MEKACKWRYTGFVLMNVGITVYGTDAIVRYVRAISHEGFTLFVLPMAVISGIVFSGLYPILRRLSPGLPRFAALYVGFLAALLALTAFFLVLQLVQNPGSLADPAQFFQSLGLGAMLIVGCGHLYGFPYVLGIAAVNKVLSPVFFPRTR
ncbi:MAG: hypothetical protein SFU56_07110 [Capsulimonadales bacterium]|nr:hypothetical protein [Capsulimonadales bacterium]